MRSPRLAAVLTVLALTALGACSDGETGSDAAPDPTEQSASPEAAEPTTEEYDEAHDLYHALADTLDEASQAAVAFQDAVKKAGEEDPKGFRESAAVADAVAQQEAAVTERDAAVAELGDQPAMADEELAAAYRAFADKYAVAMAYQDGFNDSFPAFLATNDACTAVLSAPEPKASALEPARWAKQWLAIAKRYAEPCLAGAAELAESTNEDVVAVGGLYEQWIADRADLVARFGAGEVSMKAFPKELKKVNDGFTTAFGETATFSETLGTLFPNAEYDAVDVVFEDRVGESEAPDASPSASVS